MEYISAMDDFSIRERIRREAGAVRQELRKRIFSYIAAGFAFVAGLAWNDAIKAFIDYLIPETGSGVAAKFLYALLVTVFVVLALYYVERSFAAEEIEGKSSVVDK